MSQFQHTSSASLPLKQSDLFSLRPILSPHIDIFYAGLCRFFDWQDSYTGVLEGQAPPADAVPLQAAALPLGLDVAPACGGHSQVEAEPHGLVAASAASDLAPPRKNKCSAAQAPLTLPGSLIIS
jgi:hypothetical protein